MGYIDRIRPKFLNFFIVFSVVFLSCFFVNGFNIDAFNYAVYGTQEESMFGFTVAVHKQAQNRGWVLVGAPEAQSQYQGEQVRRGGVVYKCRADGDGPCEEIPFDRAGNQNFGNKQMDQKSGQWFGATLSTSGNSVGGPVVACAPRYMWYSKGMNRRDPVGTCFVSDSSFEKFEEFSPCRTSNWGYHRQGHCQAGFSAAINSIGDRLFVGAPGSYYWQGQMYSIDAHARFNYTPGLLGTTYGAKGFVHQQSLETRPAVFETREGKPQDDNSYMGYSIIVGDSLGTGEQGVAVGMPRGSDLHGKVLLFSWNLTNYKNISSGQLGSYFGYSLAAADVDGDKKLDLIVGAPMHTEANTEGKYDVGRVYVFYHEGGYGSFNKSSFIDGTSSKSRFGHSLACLGDLNLDGYEDFAVGAPYDGENDRGAVYIYYGSSKGVLEKYGQVIYAEDVVRNGIPVSTFGFSVAGGLDMDGNDYPDMAVGAYLSNSAFFFRSRPVVRVESFVTFRTENKQIDIKKKNCNLPNGQPATCTSIYFCVKYSGKGIPQQILLTVQYILDTKKRYIPRMAFLRKNTHTLNETITLYKDRETCQTEEIYIKNDIRDKLTQLDAEVKYFMDQEDSDAAYYGRVRNPQSHLKPVLDLNLPPYTKGSISIQRNCGSDNICVPNLHVNVTKNVEKYLLDSNTNLEFDIIVSNFKEDAFETTLELTYPEGIYYKMTAVKDDMTGILCSGRGNRTITCDIGNPLPANKIAKFQMIFVPYHKQGMSPSYEFDVHVHSSNPEDNTTLEDNYSHITVDIWVNTALDVSGRSFPQEIFLPDITQYITEKIDRELDIGPQVIHLYTLKNKGPATIYEAEMYFLWPWQTIAGEDLLYLLDQPHVPEGVKCEIPAPANYKNYELEYYPIPIWERLRIDSSSHDMDRKYSSVTVESGENNTGGITQQNAYGGQHSSGGSGEVNERKHYIEHAFTVGGGGGVREGGESIGTTAMYEEDQIVRHQESQGSYGGQTISRDSLAQAEVVEAYAPRRSYEERRQYEEGQRQQEQRRKLEQHAGQNAVLTEDEERIKYEERVRQEEEERRRYQEQLRRSEETRIAEEIARKASYEEQIKREEERRRQQSIIDERKRRLQQQTEEEERRQQQQQREEEIRRRLEEERRRQEDERRRQVEERRRYELEGKRRIEEEERSSSGDLSTIFERRHNASVPRTYGSAQSGSTTGSGQDSTAVAGGTRVTDRTFRLDAEIESSSGDSSTILERRHNVSVTSTSGSAQSESSAGSGQDSTGHISQAGETVFIKSEWVTTVVNEQPVTKWMNITTIKDATGKIISTSFSTSDSSSDQMSASSNVDSFGQNVGQNAVLTADEERIKYEERVRQEEERRYQEQLRRSEETRIAEEKARQAAYEEEIKREEESRRQQNIIDEQRRRQQPTEDERRRQQQQRKEEIRRRQEDERRRQEDERRRQVAERHRLEEQRRIEEEEEEKRRQYGQQQKPNPTQPTEEERLRQQQQQQREEEIWRRQEDERRRQEDERRRQVAERHRLEEQRRIEEEEEEEKRRQYGQQQKPNPTQPTEEERLRQQQQQQRDEEIWRRQELEDELRRHVEERRRYELERENRRIEEERRHQYGQQGSGASSTLQQSGMTNRASYGGRVRTGYFDAQGNYHDETGASRRVVPGVAFNHTWTVEGTASLDDAGGNQGGQIAFGQAAASGNQFRTQTIDLGMAGAGSGGATSSRAQGQEHSGERQWISSGQRTQGGTFSGTLEGGVSGQNRYSSEWQRTRWEDEPVPPQTHNQVERDNVPTEHPDLSRHRGKRQVPEIDPDIDDLKCTATRCLKVKCVVGTLKKDEFISIALRSRLNVRAVRHLSTTQPIKLSSIMAARISKLPYIGKPKDQELYSHEIFTDILENLN